MRAQARKKGIAALDRNEIVVYQEFESAGKHTQWRVKVNGSDLTTKSGRAPRRYRSYLAALKAGVQYAENQQGGA